MIVSELYWEKYRPQTLEEAVILPRILKEIQSGIQTNLIFEGAPGCGKTTIARILANQYNYKLIDASKEGGIDTLRTKIESFVSEAQLFANNKSGMKIVYLEEFDRASPALQDGLRGYIESNAENVRFLATVNHIHKIEDALLSRMSVISFNPINKEERSFLLNGFAKRAMEIAKIENIEISKEDIIRIVKKHGHDMRLILTTLQRIQIVGSVDVIDQERGSNDDLYDLVLSKKNSVEIYNYLLLNCVDSPEEGIIALGQGFLKHIITGKDHVKAIPAMVESYNTHQIAYPGALDPLMVLFSLIQSYQKIL